MKYSLRSLMIVVTLAAVVTGAVVAWRGHCQFCFSRANAHDVASQGIVIGGGSFIDMSREEVEAAMAKMRQRRAREDEAHERLSNEYRLAIWRPWLRFWITDPYYEAAPSE